jgi:hypothetical protein
MSYDILQTNRKWVKIIMNGIARLVMKHKQYFSLIVVFLQVRYALPDGIQEQQLH